MDDPVQSFLECVSECVRFDPLNGPRHDRHRRQLGLEYEVLLQQQLRNLPFLTEEVRESSNLPHH